MDMMVTFVRSANYQVIPKSICSLIVQKQLRLGWSTKVSLKSFLEWIEIIFTLPICTVILEENILNRIRYNRSPPKANFDYRDDRVHTFFTDGSASIADSWTRPWSNLGNCRRFVPINFTRETMMEEFFVKKWEIPPTFKTLQVGSVYARRPSIEPN